MRRHVLWALAIFALAIVVRSAWVAYANHGPGHDGWSYWYAANEIADGHGFRDVFSQGYSAARPPAYPYILAGIFKAFGSHVLSAKALNIVAGAATAVLVYALGTRLRDQRAGIIGGIVIALFPSQIYFTSVLMTETLFVFFSAALVLVLIVLLAKRQSLEPWQALGLGLFLGFLALMRAEALLLVPLLLLLLLVLGHRWLQVAQAAALIAVGMAILITPWTVRNYVRFDEFVLIRKPPNGEASVIRTGLSPNYIAEGLGRRDPLSWSELADRYTSKPWLLVTLAGHKTRDYLGDDDPFQWIVEVDFGNRDVKPALPANEESRWAALASGYYYVIGAVALLGLPLWFSRRDKALLIVIWFALAWSLIQVAFAPKIRFHFPILPMIALMAGLSLVAIWDRYAVPMLDRRRLAQARTEGVPEPAD